jgi:surface polysaccharide O-acyltransferase-like enzyme
VPGIASRGREENEGRQSVTSQSLTVAGAGARARTAEARLSVRTRVAFIDNIRVLLVVLLILHHLATTYGGEGAWYYYEGGADTITTMLLTLFVVVNQAFFMAFYFAISGYFLPRSLERKQAKAFLRDRFLRLGVPLAFQVLVIGPLLSYFLAVSVWGFEGSFWSHLTYYARDIRGIDSGSLWYVEALLIFSIGYVLWWALARRRTGPARRHSTAPGNVAISLFALAVGLITFVVRIWLPVGYTFAPLNFQLPHFPQYVGLFVLGTIAYRRGWLAAISEDQGRGKVWGRVLAGLLAIAPVLFVLGGALNGNTAPFRGGIQWQALIYALWEQFVCVAMVITLLVRFRRRHNHQGRLARELSGSAYAVYILHSSILVPVTVGLGNLALHPLLKFGLTSLICVPACFLVGGLVKRLPGAARIL